MKYKYYINVLDPNSIDAALKSIENYTNKILPTKIEAFTKALAEEGVDIAKAEVVSLDALFTGELLDSIYAKANGRQTKTTVKYVIRTDSKHAMFVEFGTGIRGKDVPYVGELPSGYEYAVGKTIHYIGNGRYGWFYPTDDSGKNWKFTEGMPSRPYMYLTAARLHSKVQQVAKKVFGGGEYVDN
mgnify:CR=1 FL=1